MSEIRKSTNVRAAGAFPLRRLRKRISGVKLPLLYEGAANVKYGQRRIGRRLHRLRMPIQNGPGRKLRSRHFHWDMSTAGACTVQKIRRLRRVIDNFNKTHPPTNHLNYTRERRPIYSTPPYVAALFL